MLTTEAVRSTIQMKHLDMAKGFTRRLLVLVAILALAAVSTAAVAHGHPDANSSDESHCPLCMALHCAKQAVVAPIVAICFTPVQADVLAPSGSFAIVFVQPLLTQDRAPPLP
jgi:hypothetical protein